MVYMLINHPALILPGMERSKPDTASITSQTLTMSRVLAAMLREALGCEGLDEQVGPRAECGQQHTIESTNSPLTVEVVLAAASAFRALTTARTAANKLRMMAQPKND